jgi:hypothetical protein
MSFDLNDSQSNTGRMPEDVPAQPAASARQGQEERESDFESLLAAYEGRSQTFSEGEVIKGRVIAVTGGGVVVDVGFKSEGIIPIGQFQDDKGQVHVKVGDTIDVFLEQTEDANGYVVLSREKAERMKIWDDIERAYRDGSVVKGRVIERIKGGLAVDIGVRAFLPGSAGAESGQPARRRIRDARDKGQQEAGQHCPVPQGRTGGVHQRGEGPDSGGSGRGQGHGGGGQEHYRLRGLHRPGRC